MQPTLSEPSSALQNVVWFSDTLVSGAEPHGLAGFEGLQALGVKTVISVDGALPDVATATKYGMRYVHVPLGYDGIDQQEGLLLLRAVRDLPKPTYVHCYHGIHRGPAATAYIAVGLGQRSSEDVLKLMKEIGTSDKYTGLYAVVQSAAPIEQDLINTATTDFPSQAKVTSLTANMAGLGRSWDRLEILHNRGWRVDPLHPDIDPANESKIVVAYLQQLNDSELQLAAREVLEESRTAASTLHAALKRTDMQAANVAYKHVEDTCLSCHQRFRN